MQIRAQTKTRIQTKIQIKIQAITTKNGKEISNRGFLFRLTEKSVARNIKGYYTGGIL